MFENCIIKSREEDPRISLARARLINNNMIDTDKEHYKRVRDLL